MRPSVASFGRGEVLDSDHHAEVGAINGTQQPTFPVRDLPGPPL